jgi:hypothetical protein
VTAIFRNSGIAIYKSAETNFRERLIATDIVLYIDKVRTDCSKEPIVRSHAVQPVVDGTSALATITISSVLYSLLSSLIGDQYTSAARSMHASVGN